MLIGTSLLFDKRYTVTNRLKRKTWNLETSLRKYAYAKVDCPRDVKSQFNL